MMKYAVHKLDEDTYCVEQKFLDFKCLCYLLLGSERALVIDTGIADEGFHPLLTRLCPLPLDAALTHAHLDHIGNAHRFGRVFMSREDRGVFALHSDRAYLEGQLRAVPAALRLLLGKTLKPILATHPELETLPYDQGQRFDLGGRTLEVIETPGHSPGSVCFLERERRRLYSGDTVCDRGILLHLDGSLPPEVFLASLRRLEALDVPPEELCTGHRRMRLESGYIREYERCAEGILAGKVAGKKSGKAPAEYLTARLGRVSITYKTSYTGEESI
jgi:glyoxylase-like metal-dependent hydrolase (beta-lactamase superfamily II)